MVDRTSKRYDELMNNYCVHLSQDQRSIDLCILDLIKGIQNDSGILVL